MTSGRPNETYAVVAMEAEEEAETNEEEAILDIDESDADPEPLLSEALSSSNEADGTELITIDAAIERLGMGKFQLRILVASGLCFAADAMIVTMLSFLSLVVQELMSLTDRQTASITSCLFAGSMLGTLVLGPLADHLGRRPVFLLSAMTISVFGFLTSTATTYYGLTSLIFCVGIGVGGLTVPFDILAEFLPSSSRGTNLLKIEYFWTLGVMFVVGVAYITLHNSAEPRWRLFVMISSIPCLLSVVLGFGFVPESARWLVAENRTEEALEILKDAAVLNKVEFVYDNVALKYEKEDEASLADLLKPEWRETTLRLWGAWGCFTFGYYGTVLAITKVFERESGAHNTYSFDYGAIFVSSTAEIVGTSIVIMSVDRIGRISSQVISYLLAGIAVCALCMLANLPTPRIILVSLGFGARVFEMAATCVTWVSTAEILTTEVRSTGHATSNAMARLGAVFCPYVVQGHLSMTRIGLIMLCVHIFTALCVMKLPETKGRCMGVGSERHGISLDPEVETVEPEVETVEQEGELT